MPLEPSEWDYRLILLDPPREALRSAIAERFAVMLKTGAVEEARALLELGLDLDLPAMRALGVRELRAFLDGEVTLREAEHRAVLATGQYIKRQATWFRHRPPVPDYATHRLYARFAEPAQFSERDWHGIQLFISNPG